MMKKLICIILICMLLVGCTGETKAQKTVFAMDTVMELSVWGPDGEKACGELEKLLLDLERTYSAQAMNEAVLTQEQMDLTTRAMEFKVRTGGAFDPQMYGVMQAWGFDDGQYRVPADMQLQTAPRLWDLGAAAKGYAGDRAVELLKGLDVDCAMLNLGGNVQTYGTKADGTPWKVGIRDPEGKTDYVAVVSVEGTMAVVTSGDYQRYFEKDGKRYHHIMDPRTGRPAQTGLRSVTVIAGDGMTADVMSTALFVMGPEKGAEFWRSSSDFEAVFVLTDGTILATAGVNISGCDYDRIDR